MKKIFTLVLMALSLAPSLHAQEYNMFNAADVDADGWLWLDTQAKMDKYVGLINEETESVDPNGAMIQMVYANVAPDFPATTADANILGYGTDGNLGTDGARKGAIMLAPSSALMTYNGGAVVVRMPSCATFAVCVSYGGKVMMQLNTSTQEKVSGFEQIVASSVFNPFARAGVTQVTGLEKKKNGTTGISFLSDTPKYAMLRNGTKDTIYIHGFKITTPKAEATAIRELPAASTQAEIYTADGIRVAANATEADINALKKGIYVVRRGNDVKKITVK